ncbi:MAG: chalcone isomerase family protein [Deltaproteobacteria bacterium]|nr:chalcone isomerase family protein [Deltaproteobacteria bacterium]
MKRTLAVLLFLLLASDAKALEVSGVTLAPVLNVNNQTLTLNGYGIRKKFIIKVYVGSLYCSSRASTLDELLRDPKDKLIRMNFLHSKVEKGKIVDSFSEGLEKNAPEVARSPEAKKFLSFFRNDFVRGDTVDLVLGADGTVAAKQNGKVLGTVQSGKLANGILSIYLGEKPADSDLKKGMLGIR